MRRRTYTAIAIGAVALLVAGGLFASNMGFKLNYRLDQTGDNNSFSGTSSLALPYNQQTSLLKASDLYADINATAGGVVVASISKLLKNDPFPTGDALQSYTGASSLTDFDLAPGEGYRINVSGSVDYIIVGSHDPGLVINLDAAGTNNSFSGTTDFAYPYHSTAATAADLYSEINTQAGNVVVASISKLQKDQAFPAGDTLLSYTGASNLTNFPLVPGESYRINVTQNVAYVPSHY